MTLEEAQFVVIWVAFPPYAWITTLYSLQEAQTDPSHIFSPNQLQFPVLHFISRGNTTNWFRAWSTRLHHIVHVSLCVLQKKSWQSSTVVFSGHTTLDLPKKEDFFSSSLPLHLGVNEVSRWGWIALWVSLLPSLTVIRNVTQRANKLRTCKPYIVLCVFQQNTTQISSAHTKVSRSICCWDHSIAGTSDDSKAEDYSFKVI